MVVTKPHTLLGPEILVGLVTLLVNVLIALYPPLEELRIQLMIIATTFGALLITGQLALRFHDAKGVPFYKLPFFGPLWALGSSRKFLVAAGTLIADMIIAQIPDLKPIRVELIQVFTFLGGVVVAAIAYEDGKNKENTTPPAVTNVFSTGSTGSALPETNYPPEMMPMFTPEVLAAMAKALVPHLLSELNIFPK